MAATVKAAKIASDTKPAAAAVILSKRKCFTCDKFIVTNQIRAIKALISIAGTPRMRNETHYYCPSCYSTATKAS